jgi:glycosyltransferase involved in cell wall biosynthesis
VELPALVTSSGADVLISAGNVSLANSPVPQILLSRNALYTSEHFFSDIIHRKQYGLWFAEKCKAALARQSAEWADCTIAPSVSFAQELKTWTGVDVLALHHGFNSKTFVGCPTKLPTSAATKLQAASGCIRLLFVSHYNYYRDFETLFRAIPAIRRQLAPVPVRLFLTCQLSPGKNPGSYRADSAAQLIRELSIRDEVVELGVVPYDSLYQLYRSCHLYVTPAYAESFAHPLVEAMASGLPVVASDLAVHQEICGEAARFFPVFCPDALARITVELAKSPTLRAHMSESGRRRTQDFSWSRHVDALIATANKLTSRETVEAKSFAGEDASSQYAC